MKYNPDGMGNQHYSQWDAYQSPPPVLETKSPTGLSYAGKERDKEVSAIV